MAEYKINIAGIERKLQLFPVNDELDIAGFIMFGDVELTVACAEELLKIVPEHDILVTAEAKGIPICYEMARQEGKPYIVARKGVKVYMKDPISVSVNSITTKNEQKLYFGSAAVDMLKGKKVLLVDDVISSGNSIKALEELVLGIEGTEISGKACVLAEGSAKDRGDIIYLQELPLFFK